MINKKYNFYSRLLVLLGLLLSSIQPIMAADSDGDGHTDEEEGSVDIGTPKPENVTAGGWGRPSCSGPSYSNYFYVPRDSGTSVKFDGGGNNCGSTGYVQVTNVVPGRALKYTAYIANYYKCHSSNQMKGTISDATGNSLSVTSGSGCQYQGKDKRASREFTAYPTSTTFIINVSLQTTSGSSSAPPVWQLDVAVTGQSIIRTVDTDKDGIPDHLDTDSDNDGILDRNESASRRIIIDPI